MIKRIGHITLAAWLAILLLFGNTPKEFIHLFAGHTDTVHTHIHNSKGLVIEQQHHHCQFLNDVLPVFLNDVQVISITFPKRIYRPVYIAAVYSLFVLPVATTYLRGPPVA